MAENIADKVVKGYSGGANPQNEAELWASIAKGIFAGRMVSALSGAGAVVVVWLILRRVTTLFGALFGSALIAIAPGFVVHSRFGTVDAFSVFWPAMSCLFALRILGAAPGSLGEADQREPRDMRDAILAGLFAGISTGTKYTGILVLLVLWIALGMTRRPGWWQAALAGLGSCLVAFFLTTPGVLLEADAFKRDFMFELGHSAGGHGLVFTGTPSGFIYHFGNLAVGVGILLTLAGLSGLVFGAARKHAWAIALLAFAVVYYIVIGRAEVKFLRYTFPLLVPLAVGFGYAMGTAQRKQGAGRFAVMAGFLALGGIDFGGLVGAVKYTQFMTATDPRDEAARYLKAKAPEGTVGFVKDPWFWSVSLIPDAGMNRGQMEKIFAEVAASEHPHVIRYIPEDGAREDWDLRLLTEAKPDYVAFSSFEAADEDRLAGLQNLDPSLQPLVSRYREFMTKLQQDYEPAPGGEFGVLGPDIHDLMYIRPKVWIWKRKGRP
jgi:hypothetical protein